MIHQQVSLPTLSKVNGCSFAVSFGIHFRDFHVDLLEAGIVEMGLWLGDNSDSQVMDSGLAKQRVQGVRATTASVPDADTRQVDIRTRAARLLYAGSRFLSGGWTWLAKKMDRRQLASGDRVEAAEIERVVSS